MTLCNGRIVLSCLALVVMMSSMMTSVRSEDDVPRLDVYRMIQYDEGDQHFGSRRFAVSMPAADPSQAGDLARRVVVIDFNQLTEPVLDDLLNKNIGALLIILPKDVEAVDVAELEQWKKVEHSLMGREIPVPVYFAFDGEHAQSLKDTISSNAKNTQLVVSAQGTPNRATGVQATNYQALLDGTGEPGSSVEAPRIIAVVANSDSLGVAPELSVGADSNGSGMVALLQLARMFHKLYTSSRMQGKYAMLFLLTGAGKQDYSGARHWLASTDPRILDRIEFALCLDTIGGLAEGEEEGASKQLFVHSSKPAKDPSLTRVLSVLNGSAAQEGVSLTYVHKKINISHPVVAWEHEQFSRKRILALTLSKHAHHNEGHRSSILDRTVDKEALKTNVLVVANALARIVYSLQTSHDIFNGSYGIQAPFLEAWADLVAREPRMTAYVPDSADIFKKAEAVLVELAGEGLETAKQTFALDKTRTFWTGASKGSVAVYSVRPISFDLVMSVAVVCYLLFLLVLLQGPQEAMETLKNTFWRNQNKSRARNK